MEAVGGVGVLGLTLILSSRARVGEYLGALEGEEKKDVLVLVS